ncbi:MAG: hypothetical protein LBM98_13475 [Oscillospiraceae bacterium]|nr:hypothetical protein [Oscillospiraceae bacterium]
MKPAPTYSRPTPIPSVEGCRPQAAGWFPPQDAPPSKPPVIINYSLSIINCHNLRL